MVVDRGTLDEALGLSDEEVDRIFRALADATRRDIVRRTLGREVSVSDLASAYDMSFAAVQKHVVVLEGAGLVTKHPQGRERLVRGNLHTIQRAQALLDRYEQIWRSVEKDLDALTMTVIADFAATRERLWEAYTDPRQIEKFWGPVEWPATFTRHDVFVGGRSAYVMTGPGGERSAGFWEFLAVDDGKFFEVRDGFADEEGEENAAMPSMRMSFAFEDTSNGSRLVTTTHFGSLAQLEQLLEMGMEEGMASAMSQIDQVLADLESFAAGRGTDSQILSDTQVRVSRIIRGTVEQVWKAHHDPALLQRWMLGPDGWTMPVCKPATEVGGAYRYEWEPDETAEDASPGRFGFEGELLESDPPHRSVTTERMIGMDGPGARNELTLTPTRGGTLMCLVITYPSAEVRDMVLGTGMVDGMEASYARLESVLQ